MNNPSLNPHGKARRRPLRPEDVTRPEPVGEPRRTDPSEKLERVSFDLPRCPDCGSTRLRTTKTVTTPDPEGTVIQRWQRCVDCGHAFVGLYA